MSLGGTQQVQGQPGYTVRLCLQKINSFLRSKWWQMTMWGFIIERMWRHAGDDHLTSSVFGFKSILVEMPGCEICSGQRATGRHWVGWPSTDKETSQNTDFSRPIKNSKEKKRSGKLSFLQRKLGTLTKNLLENGEAIARHKTKPTPDSSPGELGTSARSPRSREDRGLWMWRESHEQVYLGDNAR